MNKKQMRDAVQRSINAANEGDAKYPSSDYYGRKYQRLVAFVAYLTGGLEADYPDAADLMSGFSKQVIHGQNPLLDAADTNKDKPQ